MEDILINEPLVDAFYGYQCCNFCDEILDVASESTYLTHLATKHTRLLDAFFSCPACLVPKIESTESYPHHYADLHSQTTALMFVLNETSVHTRTQHAHLLNCYIISNKSTPPTIDDTAPRRYVSHLGGYSTENPRQLEADIKEAQINVTPEELLYVPEPTPSISWRRNKPTRQPSPEWETVYRKQNRSRSSATASNQNSTAQASYQEQTSQYREAQSASYSSKPQRNGGPSERLLDSPKENHLNEERRKPEEPSFTRQSSPTSTGGQRSGKRGVSREGRE